MLLIDKVRCISANNSIGQLFLVGFIRIAVFFKQFLKDFEPKAPVL